MTHRSDEGAIVFRLNKHSRSRKGCQTCRSRKVKCDEEHPQCRNCIRAKRECVWARPWNQLCTVVKSSSTQASEVANRRSNRMSDIITISLEDGHKNAYFRNADSSSPNEDVVLPSWSSYRTSQSNWDYAQVELLYWRGFRMRPLVETADLNRNQALVTAMSHYLPLDESSMQSDNLESWSKMSFLTLHNGSLFNPQLPALAAAVDTFSLTQAAVRMQDGHLAQQAIKNYTVSIALLRRSIELIDSYDRNEVLLTIMLLQISEPFAPISQVGGWISHVDGAAQMIHAEGPRPLNSPYETALFNHARQFTIIIGMLRRQDVFFNQPQWLALTKSAPEAYHATSLLDIGTSIPGMLAETDKVLSKDSPGHFVYELLHRLDSTGDLVVTWINDFFSSMAHEISTTNDIAEMDSYNEEMNGDTTMLPVYKFASHRTAWNVTLGWVFHFAILKTMRDILTSRTDIRYKFTTPEVEFEMFRVVTNLSMVIPQLFDRSFGAMGRAVITIPLGISTEFYTSSGQTMQLEWCRRVARAVYNPREGLKQIQKPGSKK